MNTTWGARQRKRSIRGAVVAFTLSILVVTAVISGVSSAQGLLALAALSIVFGALFWAIYQPAHDAIVRSRLRRAFREQLGDRTTWRCEIELRNEGVWSRDHGVEFVFPWSDSTEILSSDAGVELRFRTGFIVARSRAFETAEDRQSFLAEAKALVQANQSSTAIEGAV